METYLNRLYGFAFSLCGDQEDAKDLVQECVVKALSARSVPTRESAYRAWLFKILRNCFLDECRRRKHRQGHAHLEARETGPMEYWDCDDRLITMITVKSELSRLDKAHREIIGLIDISGLSYTEAAETLGVPLGTVMSRISRARAALLKAISESNIRPLQTRRMDREDIRTLRRWHREAALRAVEADFDIVYVYATHGYL
ncbi:MAG: sigma-70 family RNA polymerase sigma factor, partial [Kiloniellales bacterium]|nr:sigma-70 family RNA polymerase sigma factor [Kiloniellales bacterium]